MSGHNKWSTIKHKKGKLDAKRGKVFTKIIRELTVAAKMGGGDPNANSRLRLAMSSAREANMPKDTMMNAIKRGTGEIEGAQYEEITYEGYGPGGAAILIDVLTDNRNRTVSEVRSVLTKAGGNLGESGCVSWMFDRKGMIVFPSTADEEKLMEAAIDAGADDVVRDESGSSFVYTLPEQLEDVKKALEEKGLAAERAEITRLAKTTVDLDEKNGESLLRLVSKLDEMDDVQNVHSNYTISDELLEKIAERISS